MAITDSLRQEIQFLEQDIEKLKSTLQVLQQQKSTQDLRQKVEEIEADLNTAFARLAEVRLEAGIEDDERDVRRNLPGTLFDVPKLPSQLLAFRPPFNELKAKLVMKPSIAESADEQKNPLLIEAPAGAGKSILAAALARDEDVRRAFTTGLFWIGLGQQPDLLSRQVNLLKLLGDVEGNVTDTEEGSARLRVLCSQKACLLVLDDACDVWDVIAFSRLGKHNQLLITTADPSLFGLVKQLMTGAQLHKLKDFSEEEMLKLVRLYSPQVKVDGDLKALLKACGYLPAAVKLVVNGAGDSWGERLRSLRGVALAEVNEQYPLALMQAIHLSVEELGEEGEYYLALGVFADYMHIPQATVVMLWQYLYRLSEEDAYDFIRVLADRGLVYVDEVSPRGDLHLNAYQHAYLLCEAEVEKMHGHLLAAYRRQCKHGWASGMDDGYFFQYLAAHLWFSQRLRELKSLLLDFDWISVKLRKNLLHTLFNDFGFLAESDQDIKLVKSAMEEALPILVKDSSVEQLATQLLRYLRARPSPDIQGLLNQARENLPHGE